MSVVTVDKPGTDVREDSPGVGELGSGPVLFIGGVSTERNRAPRPARLAAFVTGGRVRTCGVRIDGKRVRFLDVNGRGGTAWIMEDGQRIPADEYRTVGDWFRFLLDSGSFAGVEYLR